ncbi:proline iminopeptidase-family hydrolase [Leucobacter sp. GX24907]
MTLDSHSAAEIVDEEVFVDTPHGRLWTRTLTPTVEAGPPLVLLHGGPGYPSDYLEPLAPLAADRKLVFFDQIGAGRSDPPSNASAWTPNAYVEHVELVRRALGLDRFHVLGQSWGGFLALAYTEAHPERVASLVLSSPLVDVPRWVDDARDLIARLPEEHRDAIANGAEDPGYAAAEAEFYRRHFCSIEPWPEPLQRAADGQDAASYQAMWGPNEFTNTGSLSGQSKVGVVAGLRIPNLWITGDNDEARPETLREFADMNDTSELVVLPGTHCVHLEQPEPYLGALRAFLSSADRPEPAAH